MPDNLPFSTNVINFALQKNRLHGTLLTNQQKLIELNRWFSGRTY